MEFSPWTWIGFISFLAGMLALDLGVFHRQAHVVRFREAITWSVVWIALSLGFAWLLFIKSGSRPAMEFLTGYVIEKSLSIDNVFVFAMLFTAMKVPRHCEHKVLFWGRLRCSRHACGHDRGWRGHDSTLSLAGARLRRHPADCSLANAEGAGHIERTRRPLAGEA